MVIIGIEEIKIHLQELHKLLEVLLTQKFFVFFLKDFGRKYQTGCGLALSQNQKEIFNEHFV